MTISRRAFMRAGTLVVLFTTHSRLGDLAFGQKSHSKTITDVHGYRIPVESLDDPLTYFTRSSFSAHLDSRFRVSSNAANAVVKLVEVKDITPPASQHSGRECFVLVFRASVDLPQETYTIEHGALGTFKLLLVPVRRDARGTYLEAVVNRLTS